MVSANGHEITQACMFKIVKANIPHLPDWLFKRPNLNHNYITASFSPLLEHAQSQTKNVLEKPKSLGNFKLEIQETFLIEDLLYAFTSIEGVYIRRHNKQWMIEPHLNNATCDLSLQFLVRKMLPLCQNHDTIQEFVNLHS